MNIFYLDNDPEKSAQAQTNKHVVKMIVESAQLLSTAHRFLDGEMFIQLSKNNRKLKKWGHPFLNDILYKSTHVNHPSSIWVRQSVKNYNWLYKHFIALCQEYTLRYGKIHMTERKLKNVLKDPPKNIPPIEKTQMICAIGNEKYVIKNNPVKSYRIYYMKEKLKTEKDFQRFYKTLKEGF